MSPCTVSVSRLSAPVSVADAGYTHASAAPAASRPMAPTTRPCAPRRRDGNSVLGGMRGRGDMVAAVDGRREGTTSSATAPRSSDAAPRGAWRDRARNSVERDGRRSIAAARAEPPRHALQPRRSGWRARTAGDRRGAGTQRRPRVAVAGRRARFPSRLLRRHVAGRAEHGPGAVSVSSAAARAMPKSETRTCLRRRRQVGGLHVAVAISRRVRVERRRRLVEPAPRLLGRHGPARSGRRPCQPGRIPSR